MYKCQICDYKRSVLARDKCRTCNGESGFAVNLEYLRHNTGSAWCVVQKEEVIPVTITGFEYSRGACLPLSKEKVYIRAVDGFGRMYTVAIENLGLSLFFSREDAAEFIRRREQANYGTEH